MAGKRRRNQALDMTIVAATLGLFAIGAWMLIGMQGHAGKKHIADDRAGQRQTVIRGQITEPLPNPMQAMAPGKPAVPLPSDLHPTGATITRTGKLQDARVQPPSTYRTKDEPLVVRLYQSLLALEFVPDPNGYFCPMDTGISYEVQFAEGGRDVLHVKVSGSGCRFVYADDGSAYREDDAFRQAMLDATGMNELQFAGDPDAFKQ